MRCHDLEIIVLLLHKIHTNTYMKYDSLCTNYDIGTNKIYNVLSNIFAWFHPSKYCNEYNCISKILQLQNITTQLVQRIKMSSSYCDVKILQYNKTLFYDKNVVFQTLYLGFYSVVMPVYNITIENCKLSWGNKQFLR